MTAHYIKHWLSTGNILRSTYLYLLDQVHYSLISRNKYDRLFDRPLHN